MHDGASDTAMRCIGDAAMSSHREPSKPMKGSAMATHTPRLLLICVGTALLAAALVGCGAPSTPASSPARTPQLACVLGATAQPIDTVGLTLSCTVTHAPASESAFTAHDTFVNKAGQSHTLAPACHGALVGGSGHCMQSYSVPAPFLLTNGTVTGSTQPHNYSLGPVSPTVRQPSPAQTPSLPLGPLATPTPLGAPQG